MTEVQSSERRPRKRSPSYPAINLEQAIARAADIWRVEHDYAAPLATVFTLWGYKSTTGNANLVVAALRNFGLIQYEGSGDARKVQVTPFAIEILDHPQQAHRKEAIKRAALSPAIHRELWERFGSKLPSDDSLRWELERERDFSHNGATEFIREYRQTLAFAGLTEGDKVGPQESDEVHKEEEVREIPPILDTQPRRKRMTPPSGTRVYAVPVRAGTDVEVEGPFPLTEDEWTQFMLILNAMKGSLVSDESRSTDDADAAEQ